MINSSSDVWDKHISRSWAEYKTLSRGRICIHPRTGVYPPPVVYFSFPKKKKKKKKNLLVLSTESVANLISMNI